MENNGVAKRKVYTIDEVALVLGISRPTAYRLIREGKVRTVRAGKRHVIPIASIDAYLAGELK